MRTKAYTRFLLNTVVVSEWFAVSGGRFRNLLQRTDKSVVNRPTNPDPIVPTWEVVSSKREATP